MSVSGRLFVTVVITAVVCVQSASSDGPQIYTAFQGATAELSCHTEDAVTTIFWKKGPDIATATTVASFENGARTGSDGDRITMLPSRALSISDIVLEDEGLYFCEATLVSSPDAPNVTEAQLIVPIAPREPFPTVTLAEPPNPEPSTNASCAYTLAQGTEFWLACEVDDFRPAVEVLWFVDGEQEVGTPLQYSNNSDGLTRDVYSGLKLTMGKAWMGVSCEVRGSPVEGGARRVTITVCPAESTGGGIDTTKIIIIVVIVLVLTAALVGLGCWVRTLVKDTMVRSNYTKAASADDDTPSRTRMSNFCHICCAACCPCLRRDEVADVETRGRRGKSSQPREEHERKRVAPSAALKAKIQQKKQKEGTKPRTGEGDGSSAQPHVTSPMLQDDAPPTSTPVNEKPPGARPKVRPSDDTAVVIRDPSQRPSSKTWDEEAATGEAETGF